MVFHHSTQAWTICGNSAFRQAAHTLMEKAHGRSLPVLKPGPDTPHTPQQAQHFQQGVKKALEQIRTGQIYQVNLAWEVQGLRVQNALHSYLQLRRKNPSARSAFIRADEWAILSNSPELFLQINMTPDGIQAISVPIKGTAAAKQPNARQHLIESHKERAELTMITDLVRNDLGRVSKPGSVQASRRRIRACGDLYHAEQSVHGLIHPHYDSLDVLSACFPPGSVTGAPKVRAMELIHEIEDRSRGVYTGAIGLMMDNGSAHWNVAIRTASIRNGIGRFHIGAGIVADSDPEQEWLETLAKGNMLARWLQAMS